MALSFPNSPTEGQIYTDTPSGNRWVWDSANTIWKSTSTFTQTITVSSTAPGTPVVGQLWWNQDYGRLLVYYNDGTSSQWVDASPSDYTSAQAYNTANAAFGKANNALANTSGISTAGALTIPGTLTMNNGGIALNDGYGPYWGGGADSIYVTSHNTVFNTNSIERMRIDSSGRVGIGTTSPTYPLVVSKNGYQGLEFSVDGTADAPVLISYNRANGAYSRVTVAAANIYFLTGTASVSERMVIGSTGVQSIQFAPTQVASADANTLDDYEEGTWTPTFTGLTSGTGSHTQQTGYYVKVGRNVTVWFIIRGSRGTCSGTLVVSGLPYTAFNGVMDYGYMTKVGATWGNWSTSPVFMYASNGNSYIGLWDNSTNFLASTALDASLTCILQGQLNYLSNS